MKKLDFKKFREELQNHFNTMIKDQMQLFEVELDTDELWNVYLDSFLPTDNQIFRERREHDCSCCRGFIKRIGNTVAIKGEKIITMWDFKCSEEGYQVVVDKLAEFVRKHVVTDIKLVDTARVGVDVNYEDYEGKTLEWNHLFVNVPAFMLHTNKSISIAQRLGEARDNRNVFKRSLDEISMGALDIVLELIASNSLYKGQEWEEILKLFKNYKETYSKLSDKKKELYTWKIASTLNVGIARLKNHSIGTLLVDLSEGKELEAAVKAYEFITAPSNYKRPTALITPKMIENAEKAVIELGLENSLPRRFATIEDISVNDILFVDRNITSKMKDSELSVTDVFGSMKKDASAPKKFDRAEEIGIEDFISKVLPTAEKLEVLFEGNKSKNLVSLIAPVNPEAKSLLKWNNGFSWAYSGNITDSEIKNNVKAAGGNVSGVLRFSIQWNDISEDRNDLDAYCVEPSGNTIYFGARHSYRTDGKLDIDIRHPEKNVPAVENIYFQDKTKLEKGTYLFKVKNYDYRGGNDGVRCELEVEGQIYNFDYRQKIGDGKFIEVVKVEFDGTNFKVSPILPVSGGSSVTKWNLKAGEFTPVSTIMYSPNFWHGEGNEGVGHKHYMFMLNDCRTDETPNGFFNEFISNELVPHRKVFEVLGSKMKVKSLEDTNESELSGLGFSSTKRDELIVKVIGKTERIIKIKF